MKRISNCLLIVLMSLFFVASCTLVDKIFDNSAQITLSGESEYLFDAEGGYAVMMLESNKPWTVSSGQSWCTVSPKSGEKGNAIVTINAEENGTYDERNAKITFTSDTTTKIVTITQKQKDALLLSSSKVELTSGEQLVEIVVNSNIEYTYEIEESAKGWILFPESTKAMTSATHVFAVKENENFLKRKGKITFRSGAISEVVTIYQSAAEPTIVLTQNEYEVGSDGDVVEIQIRSNVDYEMVMPAGVDWIVEESTKSYSDYTHYITVLPNTTYDNREAVISFTSGKIREEVKIVQNQKDAIILTSREVEVTCQQQEIEVEVKHNVDYTYEIDPDAQGWIKYSDTKAMTTSSPVFMVSENEAVTERMGKIVFRNGDISDTVTITQSGAEPVLSIPQSEYIIPTEGKEIELYVKANVKFDVIIPEDVDWLEITGIHSASDGIWEEYMLYVEVAPNTSYDSREAIFTVVANDWGIKEEINVLQVQKDAIVLASSVVNINGLEQEIELEVNHNIEYTYEIESSAQSWISEVSTKAMTTSKHTFVIKDNHSETKREGKIIFKCGDIADTVTICQDSYPIIVPSSYEYRVSSEKSAVRIRIQSNVDYTMVIPDDVDWLEEEQGYQSSEGDIHSIIVMQNDAYDSREAEILFVADIGDVKAGVRIIQQQKDAIILSKDEYVLDSNETTITIDVATNMELEASSSVDWIIYEPATRALEDVQLNFSVESNLGLENREGVITISSGELKQTVNVMQLGNQNCDYIVITHTNNEFVVPTITGENLTGIIDWGDGNRDEFSQNVKHTYSQSKKYKVEIKLVSAETFEIPNLVGIEELDFSRF